MRRRPFHFRRPRVYPCPNHPQPTAKAGHGGPSRAIACFRVRKPINTRQKPSHPQPRTSRRRATPATWRGHYWVHLAEEFRFETGGVEGNEHRKLAGGLRKASRHPDKYRLRAPLLSSGQSHSRGARSTKADPRPNGPGVACVWRSVALLTGLPANELGYGITTLSPGPPSRTSWPPAADQDVVAGAAEQRVVAGAADQDVVAVAAVGRELDRAGGQARGLDHVVAGQGVDDQPVVGGLGAGDVHLGGQAEDGDAARIAGDGDRRRRRWCR